MNCPSCNAALELPKDLEVVHCMYCGTKLLLSSSGFLERGARVARLRDLCAVAQKAGNHSDALRYSNNILEIDPSDVQAWVDKAIATWWLTTGAADRFEEAMGYLARATELAPGDARVSAAREEIAGRAAGWYSHLGNEAFKHGEEVYRIYSRDRDIAWVFVDPMVDNMPQARESSSDHYLEAMAHFMKASALDPSNLTILENIDFVARTAQWISWSDIVEAKRTSLGKLKQKEAAEAQLSDARTQLKQAEMEYSRLRGETGLFASMRTRNALSTVEALRSTVARLEKEAAYAPR